VSNIAGALIWLASAATRRCIVGVSNTYYSLEPIHTCHLELAWVGGYEKLQSLFQTFFLSIQHHEVEGSFRDVLESPLNQSRLRSPAPPSTSIHFGLGPIHLPHPVLQFHLFPDTTAASHETCRTTVIQLALYAIHRNTSNGTAPFSDWYVSLLIVLALGCHDKLYEIRGAPS
jgi:hypothetical protein